MASFIDVQIAIVLVGALILAVGIGYCILWTQYRVPGKKAIVQALELDQLSKFAWRKGPKNWTPNDAVVLCDNLRNTVTAGTAEERERLCRVVLERVARRTNTANDWAKFAESAENVAVIADEAGHWRMAEIGWKRAAKASPSGNYRAKADAAGEKADDLEHRDQVDTTLY